MRIQLQKQESKAGLFVKAKPEGFAFPFNVPPFHVGFGIEIRIKCGIARSRTGY